MHRGGPVAVGEGSPPRHARSIGSSPRPSCARCSPICRKPATTPSRSRKCCAVMAETRKPLLPVCPKVHDGATEEETVRAMAIEGLAGPHGRHRRRRGNAQRNIANVSITNSDVIAVDGLLRLLPHRRRFHSMGETTRHSGRTWPRLRCRLGRRMGFDHHRSGSDYNSICCSNASSIRSACRCPTSTSTSARKAATGSSNTCARNTAATASRKSSHSANCRPVRRCATSGGSSGCPTARSTASPN